MEVSIYNCEKCCFFINNFYGKYISKRFLYSIISKTEKIQLGLYVIVLKYVTEKLWYKDTDFSYNMTDCNLWQNDKE